MTGFPWLDEEDYLPFPNVEDSTEEGIVASGGNLSPGMLLSAYRQGIFPWYSEGQPILWWSPDPRFVIFPDELHVSRSLRRSIRRSGFTVTVDRNFATVMRRCGELREDDGTWITRDMLEGYCGLHGRGYAHSVETWRGNDLVGGLYGVSLGRIFFGESMFSTEADASKIALVALVYALRERGFPVIDSQVRTPHLVTMGARDIPRSVYLEMLERCLHEPTIKGNWGDLFADFPDSAAWREIVSGKTS